MNNKHTNLTQPLAVGNPPVGARPVAPAPSGPASGSLLSAATLAVRLNDARDTMKRFHGVQWPAEVTKYRQVIESHMARNPKFQMMEVVLRLGEKAQSDGQPFIALMFLAVGAEMASENNKAEERL